MAMKEGAVQSVRWLLWRRTRGVISHRWEKVLRGVNSTPRVGRACRELQTASEVKSADTMLHTHKAGLGWLRRK